MGKLSTHSYYGRFLLFFSLITVSCQHNSQELVNQSYLASRNYKAFRQKANQESELKKHQRKTLQANLELLPRCNKVRRFSIPLELDEKQFSVLTQQPNCKAFSADSLTKAPLKLLGKAHFRDADTYFLLVDDDILSTNRQLLAVTFKGASYVNYKIVGSYKKSISKTVTTDLKLEYDGEILKLTSKMVRNIAYPIKQHYTITTQYEIDGQGNIREI